MSKPLSRKPLVQSEVAEKVNAVAFVNWTIPTANGPIRSSKGFPIFQNPRYPNAKEDLLVALARKHGGSVVVNMQCRIMLNNGASAEDIDIDSIQIVADANGEMPHATSEVPIQ